jgi:hypothetical protein
MKNMKRDGDALTALTSRVVWRTPTCVRVGCAHSHFFVKVFLSVEESRNPFQTLPSPMYTLWNASPLTEPGVSNARAI